LEERLEILEGKEKRCILGNIKWVSILVLECWKVCFRFISHLYTKDLISDVVVNGCISILGQMFEVGSFNWICFIITRI
jgi:hypothetical protein